MKYTYFEFITLLSTNDGRNVSIVFQNWCIETTGYFEPKCTKLINI